MIKSWPSKIDNGDLNIIKRFGSIGRGSDGPRNTVAPSIDTTFDVGATLTTTDGTWVAATGGALSYSYQWQRNGINIAGKTSNSYTVVAADLAATLTCIVTASNESGDTPKASNGAVSLYKPSLEILGNNGYLWVHTQGIAEAVEGAVSSWSDITGSLSFLQSGASSLRPTRKSDGIQFDGTDDRMNEDTVLPGWGADNVWSIGLGFVSVTTSSSRVWWGLTNNNTTNIVNLTTENRLGRVGGSTVFSVTPTSGPASVFVSVANFGSNQTKRVISGTEVGGNYGTQAAGINTFTLGARRTPAASIFLQGKISWFVASNVTLSSSQMATITANMAAIGFPS